VLVADQIKEPSFTIARHWLTDEHETDITVRAPVGAVTGAQVAPAFVEARTTPLPGSDPPSEPTAMQSFGVGHDTPLNCGVPPPAMFCSRHVRPPFFVATITVVEPGRAAGLRLATPTAQQRRTVGQDSAPSSPVPEGAGLPSTSGVPLGAPRTRGVRDEPVLAFAVQPVAASATAASRAVSRQPDRRAPRWQGTEHGTTADRE
jgi:hypothetical protein